MKSRRWFHIISAILITFIILSGCQRQQHQENAFRADSIEEPESLPTDIGGPQVEIKEKSYQYNNLTSAEHIDELQAILQNVGIPKEDIEAVLEYILIYRDEALTVNHLSQSWTSTLIGIELYDYPSAINAYTENPFEDINCRQVAYLLYHSFFEAEEKNEPPQKNNELATLNLDINKNSNKYKLLFGTITSDKPLREVLTEHWDTSSTIFHDTIQLVSLWGHEEGEIIHMHCGILIQVEDQYYFFEKTDPILPYQFSQFTSIDALKEYLLKRSNDYDEMAVSINDSILD